MNDEFQIVEGVLKRYVGTAKEVCIPEEVTQIGKMAFCNRNLSRITIPKGVTEIGEYAFSGCSSLSCITISDNIVEFPWWNLFREYEKLRISCSPEVFQKLPLSVKTYISAQWLKCPQDFSEK